MSYGRLQLREISATFVERKATLLDRAVLGTLRQVPQHSCGRSSICRLMCTRPTRWAVQIDARANLRAVGKLFPLHMGT